MQGIQKPQRHPRAHPAPAVARSFGIRIAQLADSILFDQFASDSG
jgi:hypothetical protein